MDTAEEIKRHQEMCNEHRPLWGEGPWQKEPDREEFVHAGLQCLLSRSALMGNWCGYVGVPEGHPAHGVFFNDLKVEAHGGLTYSAHCGSNICHIPKKGEPDHLYWLGFDCAHCFDLIPAMKRLPLPTIFEGSSYRTIEEVRVMTQQLAEQLAIYDNPQESA